MRSGNGRTGFKKNEKKTQQVGVSGEGAEANYTWPPPALAEKTEPLSHLE